MFSLSLRAQEMKLDWPHEDPGAHTRVLRLTNAQQQDRYLHVELRWSGCGTYSCAHPLRIIIELGNFKCAALVDTGNDFNAVDQDLQRSTTA